MNYFSSVDDMKMWAESVLGDDIFGSIFPNNGQHLVCLVSRKYETSTTQ